MPTPTYTPLWSTTLASATSSITLGGVPQTYRDLIIVFNGTFASNDYLRMRFNSDSAGNYSYLNMGGYSGGTSTSSSTGADMIQLGYAEAGQRFNAQISVFDYVATDKHKSVLARSGGYDAGLSTNAYAGRWASTSAITSVRFHLWSGGNFATGTTLALYGIAG